MEYEEFIKKIEKLGVYIISNEPWGNDKKSNNYYIYESWTAGGVMGGSCWSDSKADQPVEPELEPELSELDIILEAICPSIPFLTYKIMSSKIVKRETKNEGDYYGNSTIKGYKYVNLRELYDFLVEKEIINV